MNITFKELKCPNCEVELKQGGVQVSDDVQMTKYCPDCEFRMIIIIPNHDYNYSYQKVLKKQPTNQIAVK